MNMDLEFNPLLQSVASYTFEVSTEKVQALLGEHLGTVPQPDFVAAVLAGKKIGAKSSYAKYVLEYCAAEKPAKMSAAVFLRKILADRKDAVLDIAENGVKVPIEFWFKNSDECHFHGYHRLSVAIAKGFPTIPVQVHILGPELAQACEILFAIYPTMMFSIYQPLSHPLFQLLEIHNTGLAAKVEVIKAACEPSTFLDVGCNQGFVSRELMQAGWQGVGIDFYEPMNRLQPLFERCGEVPMDFRLIGLEEFVGQNPDFPCVSIFLGFMHHYFGVESRYKMLKKTVIPWMQKNCRIAFVEHEFGDLYGGLEGGDVKRHIAFKDRGAVVGYWLRQGYRAEFLRRSTSLNRELFKLEAL